MYYKALHNITTKTTSKWDHGIFIKGNNRETNQKVIKTCHTSRSSSKQFQPDTAEEVTALIRVLASDLEKDVTDEERSI